MSGIYLTAMVTSYLRVRVYVKSYDELKKYN